MIKSKSEFQSYCVTAFSSGSEFEVEKEMRKSQTPASLRRKKAAPRNKKVLSSSSENSVEVIKDKTVQKGKNCNKDMHS